MRIPAILWSYVLRQCARDTALALAALALLWTMVTLLKDLSLLQLASGEWSTFVRLLRVILPAYLLYIAPAALVCGVMLALSRMAADSEILALRAAGVGAGALLVPVAALGLAAVAVGGFAVFELQPRSHLELKQLRRTLLSARALISPGEVRTMGANRSLYVASFGAQDCPLQGVVISDFGQRERPFYLTARCGTVVDTGTDGEVALDLREGAVHFSDSGPGRYDRLAFDGCSVALPLDELNFFRKRLDQYQFSELLGSMIGSNYSRQRIDVEIQRRLSFPLSGLLLPLLAVPLSLRAAQRGRAAGTLGALLLLVGYWIAFTALQVAAEKALVPAWSLWAPNAALLALCGHGLHRSARLGE